MATVKEEIRRMIESLPDHATWEDVQYPIYVRDRIERGRCEAADGKILQNDEFERQMKRSDLLLPRLLSGRVEIPDTK
jgi:hypothetical protein